MRKLWSAALALALVAAATAAWASCPATITDCPSPHFNAPVVGSLANNGTLNQQGPATFQDGGVWDNLGLHGATAVNLTSAIAANGSSANETHSYWNTTMTVTANVPVGYIYQNFGSYLTVVGNGNTCTSECNLENANFTNNLTTGTIANGENVEARYENAEPTAGGSVTTWVNFLAHNINDVGSTTGEVDNYKADYTNNNTGASTFGGRKAFWVIGNGGAGTAAVTDIGFLNTDTASYNVTYAWSKFGTTNLGAPTGVVDVEGPNTASSTRALVINNSTPAEVATFWDNQGVTVGAPTGGNAGTGTLNVKGGYYNNGVVTISPTAPTIGSGFGTSPSVSASNGTAAFSVTIGTGGTASTGSITLPTAPHGWACSAADATTQSTSVFLTKQTASSTTSCTLTNYNTAGAATAWVASDVLNVSAMPF